MKKKRCLITVCCIALAAGVVVSVWRARAVTSPSEGRTESVGQGSVANKPAGSEPLQVQANTSDVPLNSIDKKLELDAASKMTQLEAQTKMNAEDGVIGKRPLYDEVAAELKAELQKEYGANIANVGFVVAACEKLKDEFWTKGGVGNPEACQGLFRWRALLELSLAANPKSEDLYFALFDAIGSGWPTFPSERQRSNRDVYKRLLEGRVSLYGFQREYLTAVLLDKPSSMWNVRDFGVLFDLSHLANVGISPYFRAEATQQLRQNGELDANAKPTRESQQRISTLANELMIQDTASVLELAVKRSEEMGASEYLAHFQSDLATAKKGEPVTSTWYIYMPHDFSPEYWRRGETFLGPEKRRLTPLFGK